MNSERKNSLDKLHTTINNLRDKTAGKDRLARHEANRHIAGAVLEWLQEKGRLVQANKEAYWFDNEELRLYVVDKDMEQWKGFSTTELGINPADTEYAFVMQAIRFHILANAKVADIHVFSHFDATNNILYMSRFDGMMYCLNGGKNINLVPNGTDEVLFLDHANYQPYEVKLDDKPQFTLSDITDRINFEDADGAILSPLQQQIVFSRWFLSLPFGSILPTRPILLLVGEAGSGKTSIFRRMLHLLFGTGADVKIMRKSKEDAFIAATSSDFLSVWDNVDAKVSWLNDHLATASTGGKYSLRQLYKTNEQREYRARAFIGLTARTPQFTRDDVADRLLILSTTAPPATTGKIVTVCVASDYRIYAVYN